MSQFNKIMIFIDGSNVFHGCKKLKFLISYEKFITLLRKDRNVMRVVFYTGIKPGQEEMSLLKLLKRIDVKVVTKLLKIRNFKCKSCDSSIQTFTEKGIDASMSTDLLWFAIQGGYDIAIIVSGDADFIPVVKRISSLGKKIELWTFKHMAGKELKEKVDKTLYIDDIISDITLERT